MYRNKRTILLVLILASVLFAEVANADYVFGTPMNLGPGINSAAIDAAPSVSADGLSLFLASMRPGGLGGFDLWVATRATTDDDWGVPVNLGPTVNTSSVDTTPSISSNGLSLYFESMRPGGYGSYDIYVATRPTRDDDWSAPVKLGPPVNTSSGEGFQSISADGLELYFWSDRPGGYSGDEIWVTKRETKDGTWSEPVNLGPPVNSPSLEAAPNISSDGLMLLFQSNRPGGYGGGDIWVTRRRTTEDAWGTPVNLGPGVNTSDNDLTPYISSDGSTLYFSSWRSGGFGGNDLWQVSIEPIVDLNGDGIVDAQDMCMIVDNWGTDDSLCDIGPMPWGDGIVDVEDLIVIAEHPLFPGLGDNVIERRISAGSDDAEEALNSGYSNWNNSSDLEIVDDHIDNGGSQLIGLTFRDIDIAPGEVVSYAYIEFVCDEIINGTDDAYFLIWGHLTPNSDGFIAPFVISDRPETEAKVPWEPDHWDGGGQTIRTVNIAPIIQELIDQEGWIACNAVEIIIGVDPDKPAFIGVRCAEAYEGSPSSAPLLHIEIAGP